MGELAINGRTKVEQPSERAIVATRMFNAPPRLVYEAWTTAELFKQWWAPRSMGMNLLSCEMDVRTGGGYRLAFGQDAANAFEFFGKYLEVIPNARLVWTNDEGGENAVTTVTFEEKDGGTLLVMEELYPSKQALDEGRGAEDALPEQFEQLDALLLTLATRVGES